MSVRRYIAVWLLFISFFAESAPLPFTYGSHPLSVSKVKKEDLSARRRLILSDFAQRISPEFQIPDALQQRVAFWFDIYTTFTANDHVIHHTRYPWIIYEIINTSSQIETGKGPLWLRKQRAEKFVERRKAQIRLVLKDLSRNPISKKSSEHKRLSQLILSQAPGKSTKAKFKLAYQSVRAQLGQKDFFRSGLEQSTYYLPHMEEEFERMGLPTELTRMPFVESSFNTKAKSRVGASGIWQIMPRTGKAYLKVTPYIDERNNPIKATTAAGRLLKSYNRALKSWPLTITSYNHGIGNIRKAIKAARSEDLATIISRYHRGDFKFASSNFFACFLAALHAEKYQELMFNDVERLPKKNFVVTQLSRSHRPKTLLKMYKLSQEEFLRFNLDLAEAIKKNRPLPRGLKVFLPERLDKTLAANEMKKVRF
ncbi:lytic transglycosylase domain-containing protein [bacterium]|nr:lytic transglycosylase domain-containing protein [bacterium]